MNAHNWIQTLKSLMLLTLFIWTQDLSAQSYEVGESVKVEMKDGSKIIGMVQAISDDSITISSDASSHIIRLNLNQIVKIKDHHDMNNMKSDHKKLFVSPSAFSLQKKQWQIENVAGFGFGAGYGVTNRFSVFAISELYSPLLNAERPFTVISPRYSIPLQFGTLTINPNFILYPKSADILSFRMVNFILSIGHPEEYFNISLAFGRSDQKFGPQENASPFSIAYFKRLSPKFGLVLESWVIPYDDNQDHIISYLPGVRYYLNDEQGAFNLHAFISHDIETGDVYPLPMISFIKTFGPN